MSTTVYVTKESLWNFLGLDGEPGWYSIDVSWDNLNQAVAFTIEPPLPNADDMRGILLDGNG